MLFKKKDTKENDSDAMSFLDHLGELRNRILFSIAAVAISCVVTGVFINFLIEIVLLEPAKTASLELQNLKPFGQPFLYFKIIFTSGLILALPFILLQLWRFIKPGLYPKERLWARWITFFTSICFFIGVAFAYFVMVPGMLNFAANFGTESIKNIIDVNEYLSFITMIVLASGLLFEMPMVAFILARVGILTPKIMSKYRRHAIVLILIIAAVLTPTPDPISQLIFAAPLLVLYEISIIIARIAESKRNSELDVNNE